ncbi:MAG TPA: vanadium-dependent haloperoxidase [Archangium sp.]|nr:vanadium-dependent haloperoxidase [Archangium sp.]
MKAKEALASAQPIQPDTHQEAVPAPGTARADAAQQVRVDAAAFQRGIPLPSHSNNGDEARYPTRFASYSKGLPHDSLGDVVTAEYDKLTAAVASGNPAEFEAITLGGTRKLVNPQAAYAYQLEGADSHAVATAPAPSFASCEAAADLNELYWMSLVRDITIQDYTTSTPPSLITEALQHLNQLKDFRGPKVNGQVTAATLFRDSLPGSTKGPFLSQFLLQDVPYGVQKLVQRNQTRVAGDDRVFTFSEWLNIQNGLPAALAEKLDPTPRYIRNGRDLAEFVHHDFPLQASLNAALIIIGQNDTDRDTTSTPPAYDSSNPYRLSSGGYTKQEAFATFGNADLLDLIGRVMKLALLGQWFQKWQMHRRLRPEEFAGRVHNTKTGARAYPLHSDLSNSPVLARIFERNKALNGGTGGAYLLPQAFPEGAPLHPSYGSGHSTYIGAGVTMLKAFFDAALPVKNPVQPSPDGLSLVPYTGPTLSMGDELDKLASNIGIARLFAGVHYRSDHEHAVRLGELIALRVLQDLARTYNESFPGFNLQTFGGNSIRITATGPTLPRYVTAITSFTLIDADTDQPVSAFNPLLNGAVLRLADLPPNLNIRANVFGTPSVGSVRFTYDGTTTHDNSSPFALGGDTAGDYPPFALTPGTHVLTATPYNFDNGSGVGGVPLTLRFTVV